MFMSRNHSIRSFRVSLPESCAKRIIDPQVKISWHNTILHILYDSPLFPALSPTKARRRWHLAACALPAALSFRTRHLCYAGRSEVWNRVRNSRRFSRLFAKKTRWSFNVSMHFRRKKSSSGRGAARRKLPAIVANQIITISIHYWRCITGVKLGRPRSCDAHTDRLTFIKGDVLPRFRCLC